MTKEENEKRLVRLKNIVSNLPDKPGSYQFYDQKRTVIYVGKAKNLKNRVATYFHKEVDRFKTKVLVSKIHDITYTVVNSEEDALLLENSLIKKYMPKYNILLKDGKTYPSIVITKEYLPRIFHTRNINKKFGVYYGPYSHVGSMYEMLDFIKKNYHPRLCRTPLTKEGIAQGKYRPCLEYHIGNCLAPCIGKQTWEDYMKNIHEAQEILKGKSRSLLKELYANMMKAAEDLRFEEAEIMKIRYLALEKYAAKSEIVSHVIDNVDVYSLIDDGANTAFINYLHVTNGTIDQAQTFEFKKKLDETDEEILSLGIMQIREERQSKSPEIIVPFELETGIKDVVITVPQRGDRKKLLDLSTMNAKQYKVDRLKQAEKLNPEQKKTRLMKELQRALKLEKMPYHIECFDNSNISGTDAVAGCVVFKSLKPSKKDYRKYNIKSVAGPDDYASMQEVVRRRYTRMIEENTPLPDLIITDGGRGQMEVVRQVVEDELHLHIAIAGLAKDNRHRTNELLFGFPPVVIGMKTDSELFHILTQIQDEVHRYAITFHRDKRSKHALHSELDDIKGIGPKTKEQLMKTFKSVKKIKDADLQILSKQIGEAKAMLLWNYFHGSQE